MSRKDRGNGGGYIFPFLLSVVIIGGAALATIWLDGRSRQSKEAAEASRERIKDNKTRIHNLNAQVEERMQAAYIARKCREFKLGLRESDYSQVTYLDAEVQVSGGEAGSDTGPGTLASANREH